MGRRIRVGIGAALGVGLTGWAGAQSFTITDRAVDVTVKPGPRKESEVEVSSRTFARYNNVKGNNSRSFFQEGFFYEEHVALQERGTLANGNQFQFNLDFRLTNEDRVDPDSFLIQNLSFREFNDNHVLEVGDFFHDWNQLVLTRNLKGVAYTRLPGEKNGPWRFEFVAGVDKDRWRNLWEDTPRETLTRWAFGLRAERQWKDGADRMAYSFMRSRDDGDSAPQSPGQVPGESTVFAVDGRKKLSKNWNVLGALAWSRADANTTAGPDAGGGAAVQLDAQYSSDDQKVFGRTRFQSTDPDFLSLEGSPVPDFEKFDSSWRYNPTAQWELEARWERFHDNLDQQLPFGTRTEVPSLAATFRAPRRPFRLDFRIEDRDIETSNLSRRQDILDWTVRVEDRFGKIHAVLDYNDRDDENGLTGVAIESQQLTLSLDSRFRRKSGLQIIPAVSFQVRDQDNLVTPTVEDEIDTLTARVGWIWPNRRVAQVSARFSDRDDGLGVSDSQTQGFEASFSMPVGSRQGDELSFKVLHNDNEFQVPGNDFDETMTQLAYTHRF